MYVNTVMQKGFPANLYEAVTETPTMPVDGVGTLLYVLEMLTPKNKAMVLQRFREGFSYRKIGVLNEISGARAEQVISDSIATMQLYKDMLTKGIAKTVDEASENCDKAKEHQIEAKCREKYTKEGYHMGYADGLMKRDKAFYSYGKYDEITIDDLDLSNRSYNALQKNGLYTVSDIINTGNGLMDITNIGKKSIDEIVTKLDEIGVDVNKHFKRILIEFDLA